ncbi:MAG: hypothetical protein IPK72_15475 [Candidatus Eisenbacteria bacterium]|nr:hypothetical protein [Candidatus Eisenbacteria bacterium]
MSAIVVHWASVSALAAALFAGLVMTIGGQGFITIAWRSAVTGLVVFRFASIGGQWMGRAVLLQLAEAEAKREEAERSAAEAADAEKAQAA